VIGRGTTVAIAGSSGKASILMRLIWISVLIGTLWIPGFAAERDLKSFPGLTLDEGLEVSLFANQDQIGNAVSICFDRAGNLYSVEANRRITGTWGVTMSRWWSLEDYAGKSVADRAAMYARWSHIVPPAKLTRNADVLRKVSDEDRDGRADASDILVRFNGPLDGNAAGVLADEQGLLVANAPNIWRIGTDSAVATRTRLLTGLGVRVGVYGHDLHGLVRGPDGRVCFSIGDRGFNLQTQEGSHLYAPTRGAVFRCFPDGSGLELFHIGLRNPQDLAFNEVGDLFTVDNDMGGVDRSRVVHVIEGGDSGWDATYQLTRNFREETERHDHIEPPWFTEGLWRTNHPAQPMWLQPPVAYLTHGPSGMAFDPGIGLPDRYRDNFFVCDFRGTATRSGILSFRLEQSGAGYELVKTNRVAWSILPADIEFGWDGAMYVADWMNGWGGEGERRIAILRSTNRQHVAEGRASERIVHDGFDHRTITELEKLLGHRDRRIRQFAQFELATRGTPGVNAFVRALSSGKRAVRLRGIWGIWQTGLKSNDVTGARALERLVDDSDAEIIAQSAKVLGELRFTDAIPKLLGLMSHQSSRVRYFAAIALGRLGKITPRKSLILTLDALAHGFEEHSDDRLLRHAVAYSYSKLLTGEELVSLRANKPLQPVVLLALRRLGHSAGLETFLDSTDASLRNEAIRALHDVSGEAGLIPLTKMKEEDFEGITSPNQHRILNAFYRRGLTEDSDSLSHFAADASLPTSIRIEALKMLASWDSPSAFDWVTWHHRPLGRRSTLGGIARESTLALLQKRSEPTILKYAIAVAMTHDWVEPVAQAALVVGDDLEPDDQLQIAISLRKHPKFLTQVAKHLQAGKNKLLRAAGLFLLSEQADGAASSELGKLIAGSTPSQHAFVAAAIRKLELTSVPPSLQTVAIRVLESDSIQAHTLELLQLATNSTGELRSMANAVGQRLSTNGSFGAYELAMAGGDRKVGERLFKTHAVQCVRCHTVKGFGGDAGPDLSKISRELKRADLIKALIEPSVRIAPGFGLFEFELKDGEELAGFVLEETPKMIRLRTLDGRTEDLVPGRIRRRSQPKSAMPSMKEALTVSEVRDLVEYLGSLK
jgi:quinoprotein glucose dehydrogenase